MSDLRELYQEMIIDHGRNPRNFCACEQPTHVKEGFNPLCGDKLTLYLKTDGVVIESATFTGSGCAISTASASMMTQFLQGKTVAEAKAMFERFHQAVTQGDLSDVENLGKLAVLTGVAEFPARVKCATLAWHTLMGALDHSLEVITTE